MDGRNLSPLVLVVDDDPTIVCTIDGLMKRAGLRTVSAGDVAGALRAIREQQPSLILLDINLPDGTGFDICRSLNHGGSAFATPILFISANEDTESKIRGFESGGVDYITKPIVGAEVIARVRTHLRLKQAHERLSEFHAARVQQLASAQRNLMPSPESVPQAHFQASVRQALAAGGDFYDVLPVGQDMVDYVVADASGHDLAAALWTASLKTLITEYAGPLDLPMEIVCSVNSSLRRILPSNVFFTLIYARMNHRTGQLSMVSAGHPPAIVVRAASSDPVLLGREGDVVGAFIDPVFGSAELTLLPGDRIYLYTDGLIETGDSYEKGLQRLIDACLLRKELPLQEVVSAVVHDVITNGCQLDDTLLVAVER